MRPKILLAEDDPMTVKLIRFVLMREGYEVSTAFDGPAALHALDEGKPDLLILDIMLPGLDGYEVCRLVRADAQMMDLPILMFTALGRPADQRRGFEAGADDYLAKPVNCAELVTRVRSMLFFALA